jgi:hypothetical protein
MADADRYSSMTGDSREDILNQYPLLSTEFREHRVHPLQNYTGAGRWEFTGRDVARQHHTLVKETPTFVTLLEGGVETKYRKTHARDDMGFWGGLSVEVAYKPSESTKSYFNSTALPLMWHLTMNSRIQDVIVKSATWPAGETYYDEHVTEVRLVPATLMWVGVESSVVCEGGVFQPRSTMFFSQVRTDRTPMQVPIDMHGDHHYVRETRRICVGSFFCTSGKVAENRLLFADGRNVSKDSFDGALREFVRGCSTELVQHTITYRHSVIRHKSYRCKSLGTSAKVIMPLRRAPPVSPHKEALAQYVFNPVRMTRLHGDDALDIMADCY